MQFQQTFEKYTNSGDLGVILEYESYFPNFSLTERSQQNSIALSYTFINEDTSKSTQVQVLPDDESNSYVYEIPQDDNTDIIQSQKSLASCSIQIQDEEFLMVIIPKENQSLLTNMINIQLFSYQSTTLVEEENYYIQDIVITSGHKIQCQQNSNKVGIIFSNTQDSSTSLYFLTYDITQKQFLEVVNLYQGQLSVLSMTVYNDLFNIFYSVIPELDEGKFQFIQVDQQGELASMNQKFLNQLDILGIGFFAETQIMENGHLVITITTMYIYEQENGSDDMQRPYSYFIVIDLNNKQDLEEPVCYIDKNIDLQLNAFFSSISIYKNFAYLVGLDYMILFGHTKEGYVIDMETCTLSKKALQNEDKEAILTSRFTKSVIQENSSQEQILKVFGTDSQNQLLYYDYTIKDDKNDQEIQQKNNEDEGFTTLEEVGIYGGAAVGGIGITGIAIYLAKKNLKKPNSGKQRKHNKIQPEEQLEELEQSQNMDSMRSIGSTEKNRASISSPNLIPETNFQKRFNTINSKINENQFGDFEKKIFDKHRNLEMDMMEVNQENKFELEQFLREEELLKKVSLSTNNVIPLRESFQISNQQGGSNRGDKAGSKDMKDKKVNTLTEAGLSNVQLLIQEKKVNEEQFTSSEIKNFLKDVQNALKAFHSNDKAYKNINPTSFVIFKDPETLKKTWKLKVLGNEKKKSFITSLWNLYDKGIENKEFEVIKNSKQYKPEDLSIYLSPEEYENLSNKSDKSIDPIKSDIFSLGLILIQMMTLSDIKGLNLEESKLEEKLKQMQDQSNIDDNICNKVTKMLKFDPSQRITIDEIL